MENLTAEQQRIAKFNQIIMMIDRGFDARNLDEVDQNILQGYVYAQEHMFAPKIYHNETLARAPVFPGKLPLVSFGESTIALNIVYYFLGGDVKAVITDDLINYLKDSNDEIWGKELVGHRVLTVICTTEKTRTKIVKAITPLKDFKTQVFLFTEMVSCSIFYPPTKHFLIPHTIKLTEGQTDEFFKEFQSHGWKAEHSPMMLVRDPFAKYHGLFHGDVVAHLRPTGSDSVIQIAVGCRRIIGENSED